MKQRIRALIVSVLAVFSIAVPVVMAADAGVASAILTNCSTTHTLLSGNIWRATSHCLSNGQGQIEQHRVKITCTNGSSIVNYGPWTFGGSTSTVYCPPGWGSGSWGYQTRPYYT